jgi:hypothetical protein
MWYSNNDPADHPGDRGSFWYGHPIFQSNEPFHDPYRLNRILLWYELLDPPNLGVVTNIKTIHTGWTEGIVLIGWYVFLDLQWILLLRWIKYFLGKLSSSPCMFCICQQDHIHAGSGRTNASFEISWLLRPP